MTPSQLLSSRFHHASADTRALNPDVAAPVVALDAKPKRKVQQPNNTEQRFLDVLAAKLRRGEILRYDYEAITLRWGADMRYTADVVVIPLTGKWQMIELKGKHIWSRDNVRFRGCAAEWSDRFDFLMFQWAEGAWTRLR